MSNIVHMFSSAASFADRYGSDSGSGTSVGIVIFAIVGWLISVLVAVWIIRVGVRGGVSELLDETKKSRELLETQVALMTQLVKHTVPPAQPVEARSPAAASKPDFSDEANALLKKAEEQHFALKFSEARAGYAAIVEKFPDSKQAAKAKQQLENLRDS